jgi:hypothetical protein
MYFHRNCMTSTKREMKKVRTKGPKKLFTSNQSSFFIRKSAGNEKGILLSEFKVRMVKIQK